MSQRVFITGGASGLGRELALRFAKASARVCIGDIHEERLASTVKELGDTASALRCDVTNDGDLERAAAHVEALWGGVDVVINNAGVAHAGSIERIPMDDWRLILDVNVLGVVRGCRAFTPIFKRQKSGHFVNVASMAGLLDVPFMSSYNVSKAAVVSLSETLENELSGHGIAVSVVCPSFFRTNLHETLRTPDEGLRPLVDRLLSKGPLTAAQVADHVYAAIGKRDFYVLPHAEGRKAWLMKRLLPRKAYAAVMRRQTEGIRRAAAKTS